MQTQLSNPIIRTQFAEGGEWVPAPPEWVAAYVNYKNRPAYSQETPVTTANLTVYRERDDCYMPTRIRCNTTGAIHPIMDCADVRVFLQDADPVNWYPARDYQMWAYRDFVYDPTRPVRKFYASKYSSHLFFQRGSAQQPIIDIGIDGLPPNIIFSMSRNETGSGGGNSPSNHVFYERNDAHSTRVRICDHEGARAGFRGFYARITMDPGIIVTPPLQQQQQQQHHQLPVPPLAAATLNPTDNEDDQCILCYTNQKNIEFGPCTHFVTCSECYVKMSKPRECHICRQYIAQLIAR
jgi:hypothetical protein